MKIERGIIGYNHLGEMIVRSLGHINPVNIESQYKNILRENDKVLGIISSNKFCICSEFKNRDGSVVFGYLFEIPQEATSISIQSIIGFNQQSYDQFKSEYALGEIIAVS